MDNWFNSKWFVRGVSLAFAVLLAVFVHFELNSTQSDSRVPGKTNRIETLNDVPLQIKIDAERFVVSGVPETVNVSLEGVTSVLTPIVMQRNVEMFVDLRGLEEGTHTVDIKYDKIPSELSVYIEPKTIDVEIEERASEDFAVSVDFINEDQLPEGYELGEPEVKPGTVQITSSKSVIEQIGIVKVYIDVADLTESINNREVPINVYDSQGNPLSVRVSPESAVVSVPVENPSKVVPIKTSTTGELPEGYHLTSMTADIEEIEVFAASATLENVDELFTEEIDLSEVTESGIMEIELELPEGVRTAEDNVIKVDIELEQTRTIEDISIDVQNQDGQDVLFIEPESSVMSITIVGNDKDIKELTSEDFQVFIDTSGLPEGVHEVPVSIEGPENVDSSLEFDQVTIEIMS